MSDAVSREAALAAIEECTCLNCRRRPCLCAKGPMIPELAVRHAIAALPPVSPLGLDRETLDGLIDELSVARRNEAGTTWPNDLILTQLIGAHMGGMVDLRDAILDLTDSQNQTVTVTDSLPPEASAEDANHPTTRQHSLHGEPAPQFDTERSCFGCGAAFWMATLESGVRGVWREGTWYCSIECADTAS